MCIVDLDVVQAASLVQEAFAGWSSKRTFYRVLILSATLGYIRLGMSTSSLRACTLLAHLYDHLATSDPAWTAKRNAVASEYLEVAQAYRQASVPAETEWSEVREIDAIVKAVQRAVLASITVA